METHNIKVIALDLDGTLTQHKTKLDEKHSTILDALHTKYRLLMVGAGQCSRIFQQMNCYPIDIIGNYGMQYAKYDHFTKNIHMVRNACVPCQKEMIMERISVLRKTLGLEQFFGNSIEFHDSGCITFPLLGTNAPLDKKLQYDPDRRIRRKFYPAVVKAFPEYTVFIGGSSSFDMAPLPYNKYYALDCYCRDESFAHENVLYIGDDYGLGGNDEVVYRSDISFLPIDDYRKFPEIIEVGLLAKAYFPS